MIEYLYEEYTQELSSTSKRSAIFLKYFSERTHQRTIRDYRVQTL